jgi:hypothetical protein
MSRYFADRERAFAVIEREQASALHERVAKLLRLGSDMSREAKQAKAKQRLLFALRGRIEHPIEPGGFEETGDGPEDVLEPEPLLVLVREHE